MTREAIEQFDADATISGLPYDRHSEAQAVEAFEHSIRTAAQAFFREPTDIPRIPAWRRVMSAMPDFIDRLRDTIAYENRQADKAITNSEKSLRPVSLISNS